MGVSVNEIAKRLGRHRSTIHREIARNRCVDDYRPDSAARRAWARKLRGSRIVRSTRLRGVDGRAVVADFDGGEITSNAGGLLLGATDRAIGLVERFGGCFIDGRAAERVVHEVATLVGQRVAPRPLAPTAPLHPNRTPRPQGRDPGGGPLFRDHQTKVRAAPDIAGGALGL